MQSFPRHTLAFALARIFFAATVVALLLVFSVQPFFSATNQQGTERYLVEKFDSLASGLLHGQAGWIATSGATIVVDPDDASNQVLQLAGANQQAYLPLPLENLTPGDWTILFRMRRTGVVDGYAGASAESAPNAFSSFEAQVGASNNRPGRFVAANSGALDYLGDSYERDTWYCVYVSHLGGANTLNTSNYIVEIKGGLHESIETLNANGSAYGVRNGGTVSFQTFYVRTGNDRGGKLLLDDIYLLPRATAVEFVDVPCQRNSPLPGTAFQKVDDFDALLGGAINGQNGWNATGSASVVPDPLDSSNQVLRLSGSDVNAYKAFADVLPDPAAGTLYFRLLYTGSHDGWVGVSEQMNPADWEAYKSQLQLANRIQVRNGATFDDLHSPANLPQQTWVSFWVVLNNFVDEYTYDALGGPFERLSGGAHSFPYSYAYRSKTSEPLRTFLARMGIDQSGLLYIDDIYFDPTDMNLAVPEAPTPTPTFTATATPTNTPTFTATATPNATGTATNTPTPTGTRDGATPTDTPTSTPTMTPTEDEGPGGANRDEYENDNLCGDASPIETSGQLQEHTFHFDPSGDVDWVRFDAIAGTPYRIEVQIPPNSIADVVLELYADCATSEPTEKAGDSFTPGVRLDFTSPNDGAIFVRLANFDTDVGTGRATYQVSISNLSAVTSTDTGALILLAGRLRTSDRLQTNIHNALQEVYGIFKSVGYDDEHIQLLATDNTLPGYDAAASVASVEETIVTWAQSRVGSQKLLTIYMIDHGDEDTFYIDEPNGQRLSPVQLDGWLDRLEAAVPGIRVNVFIEACNSGSFIKGQQSISGPKRVIVSSTNEQNLAYASENGAYFSDYFFTALRQGHHIYGAFWEARASVQQAYAEQQPLMDGDGNGLPSEETDILIGSQRYFYVSPTPLESNIWPPFIKVLGDSTTIKQGTLHISAEIRVSNGQARQARKRIKAAWAVIYPPSYKAPENSQELVRETLEKIPLVQSQGDMYTAQHDQFAEVGVYRLVIHAEDDDGLRARPVTIELANGGKTFLPLVRR